MPIRSGSSLEIYTVRLVLLFFLIVLLLGCGQSEVFEERDNLQEPMVLFGPNGKQIPPIPEVPVGPLSSEVEESIRLLLERTPVEIPIDVIQRLGNSGDPRVLWILTDIVPFSSRSVLGAIEEAFMRLTDTVIDDDGRLDMVNWLIAWDIPEPPGYREYKWHIFRFIEPAWGPFFADENSEIDWRLVAWGGVAIDDRLHATAENRCLRGCIPAIDDPLVSDALGGDWYPEESLVFGVVVTGEARAYPKNVMEVHEIVNDSLGKRRIGVSYCTLCGSARAYFIDNEDGFQPVLRTSGLLFRSNKLMYDRNSLSVIDAFSGRALSGPLHHAGVVLTPLSVVTSTWGDWKRAHPATTILDKLRDYPPNPLGGRDDHGPIFPVGSVDQRLGVQELVLGVEAADGPIAFPVTQALKVLRSGGVIQMGGVTLKQEGSGLRAFLGEDDASAHEAYWFAWSQFKPETRVWGQE